MPEGTRETYGKWGKGREWEREENSEMGGK